MHTNTHQLQKPRVWRPRATSGTWTKRISVSSFFFGGIGIRENTCKFKRIFFWAESDQWYSQENKRKHTFFFWRDKYQRKYASINVHVLCRPRATSGPSTRRISAGIFFWRDRHQREYLSIRVHMLCRPRATSGALILLVSTRRINVSILLLFFVVGIGIRENTRRFYFFNPSATSGTGKRDDFFNA